MPENFNLSLIARFISYNFVLTVRLTVFIPYLKRVQSWDKIKTHILRIHCVLRSTNVELDDALPLDNRSKTQDTALTSFWRRFNRARIMI